MEQKELERKYGKKKAKEVAQQNFQVNIFENSLAAVILPEGDDLFGATVPFCPL